MNAITKSKIEYSLANFNFNSGIRLDNLPEKDRTELMDQAKYLKLNKKTILYTEGEMPKGVYILQKGKVKISQLNPDGSIQILFIYTPGEIFGYRPILGNDKHPLTASALEECELLFIEKDHFLRVLRGSDQFLSLLMQNIGHEFKVLVNRINIFAQKGIKERLALFLLLLNEKYKMPGQVSEQAEITVNRNDLAGYTGTSVENLVRTLKVFRDNNYISTNGKSIYINDFDALFSLTGLQN